MCCLRFEDEVYAELKRQLPQKGSYVRTEEVEGEVLDYNILKQTCFIETRDNNRLTIKADDIVEIRGRSKGGGQKRTASNRNPKDNNSDNPAQESGNEKSANNPAQDKDTDDAKSN